MSDARYRDLRRDAAAGDPQAAQAVVWEHMRIGRPFDERTALVATDMANRLRSGKALQLQTEIDAALIHSGYFQLHYPTARLKRALARYFGSLAEAKRWGLEEASQSRALRLSDRADGRYAAQILLSAAQLSPEELADVSVAQKSYPVSALDDRRIGTPFYSGLAYFWNHEYRHDLRDRDELVLKAIHDMLLARGLALDGESRRHGDLIRAVTTAGSVRRSLHVAKLVAAGKPVASAYATLRGVRGRR